MSDESACARRLQWKRKARGKLPRNKKGRRPAACAQAGRGRSNGVAGNRRRAPDGSGGKNDDKRRPPLGYCDGIRSRQMRTDQDRRRDAVGGHVRQQLARRAVVVIVWIGMFGVVMRWAIAAMPVRADAQGRRLKLIGVLQPLVSVLRRPARPNGDAREQQKLEAAAEHFQRMLPAMRDCVKTIR
ncbi:MAG: hypothetical protein JWN24_4464 [Phycisphaerales bacterium]|nr:hypothetical protein [Phycisphaerales bacterium]